MRSTSPIGLIEVYGELRLDTVPGLRTAALKVMASSPSAIVLDLAGLEHVEELSVSIFRALGRMAAAAADGELIIATACSTTLAALHRSAPLYVRVFNTREQAVEAAERAPARRRVTRQLPADLHASRIARRVLHDVCNRWRLDALRDVALMIVTELVTNAVEHAGSPIELCVTVRQQILRIEVSDRSTVLPVSSLSRAIRTTHGLRLVEALASRWGVVPTSWGKTVWADLVLNLPLRTSRRRIPATIG
ncbi:MAG: ATP-binding protein [Pseudonocardiaceae bacterium]